MLPYSDRETTFTYPFHFVKGQLEVAEDQCIGQV